MISSRNPVCGAADARLRGHFMGVGDPDRYTGEFYPGPHRFDTAIQAKAFRWLSERLPG